MGCTAADVKPVQLYILLIHCYISFLLLSLQGRVIFFVKYLYKLGVVV